MQQESQMLKRFNEYTGTIGLKKKSHRILLTVSGGRDSMFMCELFLKEDFNIAIAHCNFHLRGDESDKDEAFVYEYARRNDIKLYIKHFDTSKYAEVHGISIQMAARDLRYAWFEELADAEGFDFIATAHHLDDQTETFFINLLRGTGIAGLHGILPVQGKLIRPVLFATRRDIDDYIIENNIPYREDSSNASVKYLRNKLRHDVLPLLEDLQPGLSSRIDTTVGHVRQAEQVLKAQVEKAKETLLSGDDSMLSIDKKELMFLKPSSYYLYEIIHPYGFTGSQVSGIIDSMSGTVGKRFYSKSHMLVIGRRGLLLIPLEQDSEKEVFIIEDEIEQIDSPFCLKMKREKIDPDTFHIPEDPDIACLDSSGIVFPLVLRKWEQGDYFFPLGMDNKKLLSDYFIDEKFEIPQKAGTWLLLSADDIIWIAGHRIDNRYRITGSTKEIIRFTICK